MRKKIAITLSVVFVLALLPWPYGFFQLMRFGVTIAFGYLALSSYTKEHIPWFYICSALLYQPFFKVELGRELWMCVDLAMAVVFIVLLCRGYFKEKTGDK